MAGVKTTITFFGATGGCAATSLACALREGHYCTALARTPDKLLDLLATQHNIDITTISKHLSVIQGDVKDAASVSKALISPLDSTHLVDTIYSAIGGYPNFRFSLVQPLVLDDPHICESAIASIFAAVSQLATAGITTTTSGTKPLLIALSATGTQGRRTFLPRLVAALYGWFLYEPEQDKRRMERLITAQNGQYVGEFVVVRPGLLTDGVAGDVEKLRVGWEWGVGGEQRLRYAEEKESAKAVGWMTSRSSIGEWVFRYVIVEGRWKGRYVSLGP